MPRSNETQLSDAIRVFRRVIFCHCLLKSEANKEDMGFKQALEYICRSGWLHEGTSDDEPHYVFASQIHWW